MDKDKITAIKGEMLTLFDETGKVLPVTSVIGKESKLAEIFKKGDSITVTGVSKGKGFAGVVKRHGFAGGPKTHGQSDRERAPGSIGATTTPGRVFKGKRMAGRMGSETVTVKNLLISKVDAEKNIIYIKGAIPGNKKGLITLRRKS
ncbi:50S ribosomal protein L3 [Patescibacteria group bacterium]|nr:50S ribosomal protein L3 [Patescibacteria group bacterium]